MNSFRKLINLVESAETLLEADNLPPVILSTGTNNFNQDPRKYYQQIEATVANLKARGHDVHMIIPRDSVHGGTSQEHQFSQGPAQVARAIAQKYNLPTYTFQGNSDKVHPDGKEYGALVNQINQNTGGQANKALYVGDSIAVGLGQAAKGNTNYASVGKDANWILNRVGGPPEGYNGNRSQTANSQTQAQGQQYQNQNGQDVSNLKRYTAADAAALIRQAGGTEEEARTLGAISQPESGGNPRIYNGKGRDNSYGLWQINMIGNIGPDRMRRLGITDMSQLKDPMTNARAALMLKRGQLGAKGGYHHWTTWSRGAHRAYLRNAQQGATGDYTPNSSAGAVIGAAGGALAGSANANNTPTGSNSIQNPANNDISKMKFSDDPGIAGLQRMQAMGITGDVNDQLSKANEILKGVTAQQIASDPNLSAIANLQQGLLKTSQVGKNIDQPSGNDQGGTTIIPKTSDSGKITDRLPTDDIVQNVLDPSKGYAAINPPTSGAQNNNPYKDLTTTFNKGVDDVTNTIKDKYNSIANGNTTLSAASQSNTSADDLSKRLSTMGTNIQQQVGPAFKDLADKSQDFYNKELAPTVTDTIDKINKNAPALIQKGKDTLGPSAVSAANKALDALSPGAAAAGTPPNNGSSTSIDMGDMWKKTQANGQAMLQQGKDKLLSPGLKSLSTPGAQASIPSNGGLPQSGPAASASSNSFSIDPKGDASSMKAITPDGKLQNNVSLLGGLIKKNPSIDAAKEIQQHPDFNTLPPGVQSHVNSAATGKTNLDLNVMQPHFDKLNPAQIKQMADNGIHINVAPPQQTAPASPVATPATQPAPSVSGTPTRTDSLAQKVTDPAKSYSDINPITPKVELPKVELPKVELPPTPKVELPKVELPKVELPPTPKIDTVPPPEDNKPVDLPKQPDLAPAPASPIKSSSDNYSSATAATDSGTSAWTPGKGDPGDKTSTDEEDELDKLLEQYQEFKFVY